MVPKFTPERMLSSPRRSSAVPNNNATHAIYTESSYSFETHSKSREIRILDLGTKQSTLFTDNVKVKEVIWLHGTCLLWLKEADGGKTEFWTGQAAGERKPTLAGIVEAPVANVKVQSLGKSFALVVTAKASPDGALFNSAKEPNQQSSAREFAIPKIRFWDTYWKKERNSLWYNVLTEREEGGYCLGTSGLVNVLRNTQLESPFPTTGGSGNQFDISESGIAFVAMDAFKTSFVASLYMVRVPDFSQPKFTIRRIKTDGFTESASSPVFSPNGQRLAIIQKRDPEKPSNKWVFVVDIDITESKSVISHGPGTLWDHSPDALLWSNDGKSLFVTAENRGYTTLFRVPVDSTQGVSPVPISNKDATVSSFCKLSKSKDDHRLLVTRANFVDSSIFEIVDGQSGQHSLISSLTDHGATLGLNISQMSEITFRGSGDHDVQAFVLKPSFFKQGEKYPVALLIHGGPHSSWNNSWSTRWNGAVYAEQGYIVVMPNIAGSLGFGEAFDNSVDNNWGSLPYEDLVSCFEYVKTSMPYADTTRAVALGGSYGGYMVNWIAGQPLGKEFKAMVCHDGRFSMVNVMSSDDSYNRKTAYGGKQIWEDRAAWDRYDPSRYTGNWTTPTLVIHSDNDFRCAITEGWCTYAVLQARNVESRFLNFPDENHWVLKHENSLKWHQNVLGWINKYAGVTEGIQLEQPVSEPWSKQEEGLVEEVSLKMNL